MPPIITHKPIITDPALSECVAVAEKTKALCLEILTLVESNGGDPSTLSPELALEKSRKQKQLNALTAHLKGLHRNAIMAARERKEATTEARREVDRLHLQLQNLYYEQRHLKGEVMACQEFP